MLQISLGDETVPYKTIKELKELLKEKTDDQTFADVYCRVCDFYFERDVIGDYGTTADSPCAISNKEYKKWRYFFDELYRELKKRMEKNNITETYENKCPVGHAFVAKYGYVSNSGWWFKLEKSD